MACIVEWGLIDPCRLPRCIAVRNECAPPPRGSLFDRGGRPPRAPFRGWRSRYPHRKQQPAGGPRRKPETGFAPYRREMPGSWRPHRMAKARHVASPSDRGLASSEAHSRRHRICRSDRNRLRSWIPSRVPPCWHRPARRVARSGTRATSGACRQVPSSRDPASSGGSAFVVERIRRQCRRWSCQGRRDSTAPPCARARSSVPGPTP